MKAVLALEDGTIYRGISIGAQGETRGEVVFNTSMTGYQEVLTDPSYAGQIVTMTSSQIGNYGVSGEDVESNCPQVAGFIVRESSPVASNWRADQQLSEYLAANNIVAIADIDPLPVQRLVRVVVPDEDVLRRLGRPLDGPVGVRPASVIRAVRSGHRERAPEEAAGSRYGDCGGSKPLEQ